MRWYSRSACRDDCIQLGDAQVGLGLRQRLFGVQHRQFQFVDAALGREALLLEIRARFFFLGNQCARVESDDEIADGDFAAFRRHPFDAPLPTAWQRRHLDGLRIAVFDDAGHQRAAAGGARQPQGGQHKQVSDAAFQHVRFSRRACG